MSDALIEKGYEVSGNLILVATLIGIIPAILDSLLSQTRIMYRLSKDNLIGKIFKRVNSKTHVPGFNTIFTGLFLTVFVLLFDISILS